jgi:hypothetical protein
LKGDATGWAHKLRKLELDLKKDQDVGAKGKDIDECLVVLRAAAGRLAPDAESRVAFRKQEAVVRDLAIRVEVHSDPELCRAGPGPQCSSGSGWRKETESEAEKTKQKEATQALPAWCGCSAMISACGQRATSLFNTNFFRLIDVVPAEPPGIVVLPTVRSATLRRPSLRPEKSTLRRSKVRSQCRQARTLILRGGKLSDRSGTPHDHIRCELAPQTAGHLRLAAAVTPSYGIQSR